jgi:formate dehydrogenase major subunit
VPIHQGKPGMNGMTGEHHDPDVNTPAYKEVAVKLELLPKEKGRTPLPPENYRNATRTPNDGVDATRKWSRSDYVEPPARAPHPERF